MSENNSGIRSILSRPIIYEFMQRAIGEKKTKDFVVSKMDFNEPKTRILDVGCGTGKIVEYLPKDISYVGLDLSELYIQKAKSQYADSNKTVEFYCSPIQDVDFDEFDGFDYVICLGVLHHLDNESVQQLFDNVYAKLKRSGYFLSLDGCFVEAQNPISKYLITNDRGRHIRTIQGYSELANQYFDKVEVIHKNNLLRLPYDHIFMQCQRSN